MRPDRKQVSYLYKACVIPYEQLLTSKWKWEAGEKPRILQAYIMYCEAAEVRDLERIPEMLDAFIAVVQARGKKWSQWESANRINYLGFVLKRDDIKLAGVKANPDKGPKATDFAIAGTKSSDDWDF